MCQHLPNHLQTDMSSYPHSINIDAKNDAHFTDLVPSLLDSSLNQSLSASLLLVTYCKNLGTFSKQK